MEHHKKLLWMDEIHYAPPLRNPGMMIPPKIPTNNGVPWFHHQYHPKLSLKNGFHGTGLDLDLGQHVSIFFGDPRF